MPRNEVEQLRQEVNELRAIINMIVRSDRYTFQRNVSMFEGRNVQLGTNVGTKIGTASDQKLGFYGVAPVVQRSLIADPSGGAVIDAEARTAINNILDALEDTGLMSST